jgi:hypothetical protein
MTKKFEKMTKILGEMTKMFHPAPPLYEYHLQNL